MKRSSYARSRYALLRLGYLLLVACAAEQGSPHALDGEPAAQLTETADEVPPSPLTGRPAEVIASIWCAGMGTVEDVDLHAATVLGFSAADVLARAVTPGTSQPVRLAWNPPQGLELSPEMGEHALHVAVTPRKARLRVVKPGGGVVGHGLVCQSWMEIDVTITLRSDQGALRERIEATLYTQRPDAAYTRAAGKSERLGGDLKVTREVEVVPVDYHLSLSFSNLGVSGSLIRDGIELATIGVGRCAFSEHAVTLDTALREGRVTGRAVLDRLETHGPRHVTWADGTTTELAVRFTPSAAACVRDSDGQVENPVRSRSLSVRGTLHLRSGDGRMTSSLAAVLYVSEGSSIDAAGFRVAISQVRPWPTETATLGFPKPLDAKFERVFLDIELKGEAGTISGTVKLWGYQQEPALPGNGYRQLERGVLH